MKPRKLPLDVVTVVTIGALAGIVFAITAPPEVWIDFQSPLFLIWIICVLYLATRFTWIVVQRRKR